MTNERRIVSPAREELGNLRTPLTNGEKRVFEFFDKHLSIDWEIYVQPYLNGLRPDFVLLHPRVGIAVFEVKDWELKDGRYAYEAGDGDGALVFTVRDTKGNVGRGDGLDPSARIRSCKHEIYELYCPRLDDRVGRALITAGLIFPNASDADVQQLFAPILLRHRELIEYPHYWPISGRDTFQGGNLGHIFPESGRTHSAYMTATAADDLRNWLREPTVASDQRKQLPLDSQQRSLVTTRTESGYRRIKGPAGTGKSLVLAARASQLLSEGKDVLVVTFNITLLNYLQDRAVCWPHGKSHPRTAITWLNFHAWCKRVCMLSGNERAYERLWVTEDRKPSNDAVLAERLAECVTDILSRARSVDGVDEYDAILVDEGQDFHLSWWKALRLACRPSGEMLLVADATQDLYGTARRWTDEAMSGAGFSGGWVSLEESYRLPPNFIPCVRDFAERFLPAKLRDIPEVGQMELNLYPCRTEWIQTDADQLVSVCAEQIMHASSRHKGTGANADVVFLADKNSFGYEVAQRLEAKNVHVVHTFDTNDRVSRRQKKAFFMGDARIKATTIHSFKGLEARTLVLGISPLQWKISRTATYVALTRLKRHEEGSVLIVVCADPALRSYGETWRIPPLEAD